METAPIPFSVKVVLGRATLSKESFTTLEVGDILILDQRVSDPLLIEVGAQEILRGYGGVTKGRKGVKMERVS